MGKFRKASNGSRPVSASLASPKTAGSASIALTTATGWNTGSTIDFIIYRKNTDGTVNSATQTDWTGTLAGTTVSGMVLRAGTEPVAGYAADSNTVVVCTPTAAWADDLAENLLVEHDTDTGRHILTSPKVITGVNDTNGNELLTVTPTTSAVNEVNVTNAIAGGRPKLSASGSDANINLEASGKGTGGFIYKNPYKFSAYQNTLQVLATAAYTKVQFQSEHYDTSSNFDNATNYRFTAPIAGFYTFNAAVAVSANTNKTYIIALHKNGLEHRRGMQTLSGAATGEIDFVINSTLSLAQGDYIEVFMYNGDTGPNNSVAGSLRTYFEGILVSI